MTSDELFEEIENTDNWSPSAEYPSNGFIRVMLFEFYDLTIYKLQIYVHSYHTNKNGKEIDDHRNKWRTTFYFTREGDHLKILNIGQVVILMETIAE